ncbi:hypothetical protein [Rhizobium sp. CCGE 510]|uniref:hypothetical protein n=1 Tax=Rhizobium sp. CCGE 510 TaxID=1132836 RepID=UPI00027B7E8C|nr:hypothetical protein [Rhizobium sp. CCGE 510]EJT04972.1 hypothetical protein RCCGE510_12591 [Rhizobium sp. CCGE 510]
MFPLELLSFSDNEIDLITTAVGRWAHRNHVDVESELGKAAMKYAIALVGSGAASSDVITTRLNELLPPPFSANGEGPRSDRPQL